MGLKLALFVLMITIYAASQKSRFYGFTVVKRNIRIRLEPRTLENCNLETFCLTILRMQIHPQKQILDGCKKLTDLQNMYSTELLSLMNITCIISLMQTHLLQQ